MPPNKDECTLERNKEEKSSEHLRSSIVLNPVLTHDADVDLRH